MKDMNKKFEEYKKGTYTLERENGEVIILSQNEIMELGYMQRARDGFDSIDAYQSELEDYLTDNIVSKEEYNEKMAAVDELRKSYSECLALYYDVQEALSFDSWEEEKTVVEDYVQGAMEGVR